MVTKEDLEKRYSGLSNHELMEIIENKFSYTELSISVAFAEIAKRKISEEDVKAYKESQIHEAEKFIKKNVVDDLTFLQKNLFFYLWIPFIGLILKRRFIDDEYILKLKQANYYSWFGFVSCFVSVLIESNLNFSFWICWILLFLVAYTFDETFNRQSQIKKLQKMFNIE
jgi:hypothetical protein